MKQVTTKLSLEDKLPLTCSRTGTCCHGKLVLLNPWELACLAREKKNTPREFRDLYCEFGGIRLRFDGEIGWKGQQACSQYVDNLDVAYIWGARYPVGYIHLVVKYKMKRFIIYTREMNFPVWKDVPKLPNYLICV